MPKQPRAVFDTIFAFPPNRETLGGTAYFIVKKNANLLIDCPAWDETTQQFLEERGGVRWLSITHRTAIARAKEIQQCFDCEIVVQEQEAYLLPGLEVTTFHRELALDPDFEAIWTPGHSPGSACLYAGVAGGVLFTGRHLVPDRDGNPVPLRTSKTFHWPRQLRSVALLRDRFSPQTLTAICPGANTGYLRGQRAIDRAYDRLCAIDLEAAAQAQAML
ncbi:MBL fold metallo-hydrolase [Oxynema aestuarii]|jgi:glyoxylase-like metal-dependent hydrolase (beta-lactamase superfamily II)|uniref:MBL fold metallo-hydrolase n=1 Tax=Oxynema aestuarii AP17 TaxID=2064643 RepID=A0A6H1TSG6_9CYAN|nr:MBL fold metallo-hydrolase [Oxynema aestuarii]QIZ69548.1 MBL fold metallo-hydrolase [Oxynema aestuarii AP17]RMH73644.1 MAG: MBL fold metallo-hydrolase [Cyanobacteria bacterium J007]